MSDHAGKTPILLLAIILVALVPAARNAHGADAPKAFDAHATAGKYYFEDGDMDFHFGNLILGATGNGGAEIGEAFNAARRITDGDAKSWQDAWFEQSRLAEARGLASLAGGHTVSARDQLLRAAYYMRASLVSMSPDDAAFAERAKKSRDLFLAAGGLYDPPIEYFEIPFEGGVLPGFFRKAAPGNDSAPTLVMLGGGETFAEDLYFYIAPQAIARGWNFATVDLPGQGALPLKGKFFRTDEQVPMRAVIDYLTGRPDVDRERLAVYGYSGGGLFAPQAAENDPRIKAVVMNAAVTDAEAEFAAMPVTKATKEEMASWTSFHRGVVEAVNWRYGVPADQPRKLIEANKGGAFDPAKVTVPALIIVGEGEYASDEVKRQQKLVMDGFSNPASRLVVTPAAEGASNHCVMENRNLVGQTLFDWLDEVLP